MIIYEFKEAIFNNLDLKLTRNGQMFFSIKKEILKFEALKYKYLK